MNHDEKILHTLTDMMNEIKHLACSDNKDIGGNLKLIDNMIHNTEIFFYTNETDYQSLKRILKRDWELFIDSEFPE